MKIEFQKGVLFKGDRKILITSKKREAVSIFKVALLANQLAINEIKRYPIVKKAPLIKIPTKLIGDFWFKYALIEAIQMAQKDIDWGENHNIKQVLEWCKYWQIPFEEIEPGLKRLQKTKLTKFIKGDDEFGIS